MENITDRFLTAAGLTVGGKFPYFPAMTTDDVDEWLSKAHPHLDVEPLAAAYMWATLVLDARAWRLVSHPVLAARTENLAAVEYSNIPAKYRV